MNKGVLSMQNAGDVTEVLEIFNRAENRMINNPTPEH